MERRTNERVESSLPVEVSAGSRVWRGTCINLSMEGALLRLDAPWAGDLEVVVRLDPDLRKVTPPTAARVVRSSSPDHHGTFLALRFQGALS